MTKFSKKSLDFPIVIKRVVDDVVLSVPDLGFFVNLPITRELNEDFKSDLADEIYKLWEKVEEHRTHRKWQPDPSTFKQSLQNFEEDYSLPDFVKELNKSISVSENTIRREIKRGVIRCYQTEGGHRRIPVSEVASYLARIAVKSEL